MEPSNISYIWLITGVLLLLAEALGVSGVGLMFAGLGALTTGFLIKLNLVGTDNTLLQFISFLAATALWTVALWKPMRKFYSSKNKAGYNNMIGETAYAGSSGLKKGEIGEATWSGTIMRAELAADSAKDAIEGGAAVEIIDVKGVTLIVKPK